MNEMTLPSRHRIRKSSPCGLRPSTPPLGHGASPQNEIFAGERGGNTSIYSQEEYASYGPTGGSGVQTFFDD